MRCIPYAISCLGLLCCLLVPVVAQGEDSRSSEQPYWRISRKGTSTPYQGTSGGEMRGDSTESGTMMLSVEEMPTEPQINLQMGALRAQLMRARRADDTALIVHSLLELASSYNALHDAITAHILYQQALEYVNERTPRIDAFTIYYNLANIYASQSYYARAYELFDRARELLDSTQGLASLSSVYLSLAILDKKAGRNFQALASAYTALRMPQYRRCHGYRGLAHSILSELYYTLERPELAERHAWLAVAATRACHGLDTVAEIYAERARQMHRLGWADSARYYATHSLRMFASIDPLLCPADLYSLMASLAAERGDYAEALVYMDKCNAVRSTLQHRMSNDAFASDEMNRLYQQSWRNFVARRIEAEREFYDMRHTNRVAILAGCFSVFLLLLGIYVLRTRSRLKSRENRLLWQSTEHLLVTMQGLELRRSELSLQRRAIEQNNHLLLQAQQLLESNVARISRHLDVVATIQRSLLPSQRRIQERLGECFIIYRPCEIVSGDFYWCTEVDGVSLIAVVDCAGHGVPGGLMSFVGNILLNKIVRSWRNTDPASVITALHEQIHLYLGSQSSSYMGHYSMDVSLVAVDWARRLITFSGASSSLYVLCDGVMERIRGSIMCVGSTLQGPIFENRTIPLDGPIALYLTTDGYVDQLDAHRRKLSRNVFMRHLIQMDGYSMAAQREHMEELLASHMGDMEQTDDICLLGINLREP